MSARKERFPRPPFDPHAQIDIDPDGYSRLDRMDGLGTPLRTAPVPAYKAVVSVAPDEPYQIRRSRHVAAWVTGYLFIVVLALLVVAVVVAQ